MGREFETLARDAAATNQTFAQFLLRLTEVELSSRAAQRGGHADQENAGFPVEKDFNTYDFSVMANLSKPKILIVHHRFCKFPARLGGDSGLKRQVIAGSLEGANQPKEPDRR